MLGIAQVSDVNDLVNFAVGYASNAAAATMAAGWPVGAVKLYGRPVGCVFNNNSGSSGYYFHKVLHVQ